MAAERPDPVALGEVTSMQEDLEFVQHVEDLLTSAIGEVDVRAMFGGHGIYRNGVMFALVASDELYVKADDRSRKEFEKKGLKPFIYGRKGKQYAMSYWRIPPEALDTPDKMKPWAELGVEAARRAKKSKRAPRAARR